MAESLDNFLKKGRVRKTMRKLAFLFWILFLSVSSAQLSAQASHLEIPKGGEGILTPTLTNSGTSAIYDVKVAFVGLDSPLIGDTCSACDVWSSVWNKCNEYNEGCFLTLGDLPSSGSISTYYRISAPVSAPPGNYLAQFVVKYTTGSQEKEFNLFATITVSGTPEVRLVEVSVPDHVLPTQSFNLSFYVKNEESYELRDLSVEASGVGLLFDKDSIKLDDLGPGEKKKVSFQVFPSENIDEGINSLEVTLSYRDPSGNSYTKQEEIDFFVGGNTSFDVIIDDIYPFPPTNGSKFTLSVGVLNSGLLSAKSVKVTLYGEYVSEPREYFIGDLGRGEYDTASFSILPESSGELDLVAEVSYMNDFGERVSFNESLSVKVEGTLVEGKSSPLLAVLSSFLVAFFLIYWFKRKRR